MKTHRRAKSTEIPSFFCSARIQLCRQTSFAYASFGMASCSFDTKDSPYSLSPQESVVALQTQTSQSIEPTQSMIQVSAYSLFVSESARKSDPSHILQASDSIMEILRLDSERTSLPERRTPLARHSPFLGCSQVAAAFGYAAAAASLAGQPSRSSQATTASGSTAFSTSSTNSLYGQTPVSTLPPPAATKKETDAEHHRIWKRRAILSNLAAAQSNLVAIAPTWPVAMRMAQEVSTCSKLFEQSVLLY